MFINSIVTTTSLCVINKSHSLAILSLLLLLNTTIVFTQQQRQVQSAYIYHFTKYMEGHFRKKSHDFVIDIIVDTPFISHLKAMVMTIKKADVQTTYVSIFSHRLPYDFHFVLKRLNF